MLLTFLFPLYRKEKYIDIKIVGLKAEEDE